jgi:hypothetical protein
MLNFLISLHFDPEDRGDMFVWNVEISKNLKGVTIQKTSLFTTLDALIVALEKVTVWLAKYRKSRDIIGRK